MVISYVACQVILVCSLSVPEAYIVTNDIHAINTKIAKLAFGTLVTYDFTNYCHSRHARHVGN